MSEKITIQVTQRLKGRHNSRSLRKQNQIPAVVYGPTTNNLFISLSEADAVKYAKQKFSNAILVLQFKDKKIDDLNVLKKSFDIHPVSRKPVHIDYYTIDMTKNIRVNIKINFKGTTQGEKDGGVFNTIRREVEIECLPTDIPSAFSIDISSLQLNQSLSVSDLKIDSTYKLITPLDTTIATVAQIKEEAPAAETTDEEAKDSTTESDKATTGKPEEKKSDTDKPKSGEQKKPDKK